ncbi:uncharacterized protein N7482_010388 [Penicillium canariense]|uniref:Uncharacterized protein n=1 Tax=Penicillium canariense TaxID=189055 RepID=A0A9W9HKE4_9EURO|nr:uncharacterized protein N7482_010388 [Penicillium canariense]KAJ5151136.1 hypothetical protein N7482_010388 [Penicillium canariense]
MAVSTQVQNSNRKISRCIDLSSWHYNELEVAKGLLLLFVGMKKLPIEESGDKLPFRLRRRPRGSSERPALLDLEEPR